MPANIRVPRAFTLIELLVVVAIIGILAAKGTSNLRQIGLALVQYADDYQDTLPQRYCGNYLGTTDVG
jgi:prepilin-type N-terminal cleavage/methylation domain-containing protein